MKRKLLTYALAALTIGLMGSCSKSNEIATIEDQIATIEDQIASINTSIADIVTIRSNVQDLISKTQAYGGNITELKAADIALGQRIDDLKTFVGDTLSIYAKTDWVSGTFATLEQHQWTCDTIAKIDVRIGALDERLTQAIENSTQTLKGWINDTLSAYYTAAQMDAKIGALLAQIQGTDSSANARIDSLASELTATKISVDTAKANIRSEYRNAIQSAIETSEGKLTQALKDSITAVNGMITALTDRVGTLETTVAALRGDVDALKAMIQTVSIIPAYSNGNLKAVGGILTINCVITPKEALKSLKKENFTILTSESEVLTKSALYGTIAIAKDEDLVIDKTNGTATINVDVSSAIPAEENKALTIALNVKNGISDFTTEFIPVHLALPEGTLEGKFTVNADGKQVHFSQGNLQATYSTSTGKYTWGFAANQYSYIGNAAGNTTIDSQTDGAVVDLFGWSTDAASNNWGIHTKSSTTTGYTDGNFTDWEKAYCASKSMAEGIWRTLSKDEWMYLIYTRTMENSGARYEKFISSSITIEGVVFKGAVLFPDDFTEQGSWKDTYTTWEDLDNAGLVFLPSAGYRDGSSISTAGARGGYWSSYAHPTYDWAAYLFYFDTENFEASTFKARYYGYSVRLVTECQ